MDTAQSQTKNPTWFGYARVSRDDQHLDRQLQALEPLCEHEVWQEKQSTLKTLDERGKILDYVRKGDTVVVTELSWLGRSLSDLITVTEDLKRRGVRLHVLNMGGLDLESANGRFFFAILAAAAQFERDMLSERIRGGIAAKQKNSVNGKWRRDRRHKLDDAKIKVAVDLLASGYSQTDVAEHLGVSRVTLWRELDSHSLVAAAS